MSENNYKSDIEEILSHRYDQGNDYWTTTDKRILKGSPFSTLGSVSMLLELGMDPQEVLLKETSELIFTTWQKDGRFKVYPSGPIYPCQTAHVVNLLCQLGHADDERIQISFKHLLDIQYEDGGWRCNKFSFGRGPETAFSNPFPTLIILNAFRYSDLFKTESSLDKAVEFLLQHWMIRTPIGPCHYGMGKRFMQLEYPFANYNLFIYVYILSFYSKAKNDIRYLDAFRTLESKLVDGQIVVERNVPKLSKLNFCKKGEPSICATKKYQEILRNLETKEQ